MSYFIVQVQVNYEKYVLNRLADLVMKKKVNPIRSIYAVNKKLEFESFIDNETVSEYLKETRLRNYLNNLRYTYSQIRSADEGNQTLKDSYRSQINDLTKGIKKENSSSKIDDVLHIKGYIFIEIKGDLEMIPSDIYHDIKSIPKVITIPSKYKVPEHEIDLFLNRIEKVNREKVL